MKISCTRGNVLEVALKPSERQILGADRALVKINPTSVDKWIHVIGATEGAIIGSREDRAFPYRVYTTAVGIKIFGVEEVQTSSPGKGELFGYKPKMNQKVRFRRDNVVRQNPPVNGAAAKSAEAALNLPNVGSIEHIRQSVLIINNFKSQHPKDVEIVVGEDGILKLRFLLEF